MSFSRQNPSQCVAGETISFPKPEKKEKKLEFVSMEKHDCRGAFSFLTNTLVAAAVGVPIVLNPNNPIPLSNVATTPGLRFDPPGRVTSEECGTYLVSARAVTALALTIGVTTATLDIVKLGCRGREVVTRAPLATLAAAGGLATVPETEVCLQPGESIELQIGGTALTALVGTTFSLFVQKTRCCCELNGDCDRCDCPCKKHHGRSNF